MSRPELFAELARHANPAWYHSLLDWETHQLRSLLAYYRGEVKDVPEGLGRIYKTRGVGTMPRGIVHVVVVGVDFGRERERKGFLRRLIG